MSDLPLINPNLLKIPFTPPRITDGQIDMADWNKFIQILGTVTESNSITAGAGSGVNLVSTQYSQFNAAVLPSLSITGSTVTQDSAFSVFSSGSLKVVNAGTVYFGSSSTDYNMPIPASKKFVVSVYTKSQNVSETGTLFLKTATNTYSVAFTESAVVGTTTRVSGVVDLSADTNTKAVLGLTIAGGTCWFDGFMVETQIGATSTPSAYANTGPTRTWDTIPMNGNLAMPAGTSLSSGQTAYNTGTGFWLDSNAGTARMSIGNPAGAHVTWDGSAYKIYNSSNVLVFDSTHLLYNDGITTIDSLKPGEAGANVTETRVALQASNLTNHTQDNLADGTTYARPRASTMLSGVPHLTGQTGKNACPNPGFEQNLTGTALNVFSTTVGQVLIDSWTVAAAGYYSAAVLSANAPHGGNNCAIIRLATGQSIPASSTQNGIIATPMMAVIPGDILSFGGFAWWNAPGAPALPAGISGSVYIYIQILDVNGAVLGSASTNTIISNGGAWNSLRGNYTIPSTLGGGNPAFVKLLCAASITNVNGTPFLTSTNLYQDVRFDDLYMYIGDPTVAGSGARLGDPRNVNPVTASGLRGLWSAGALYSVAYPAASPTNQKIGVNGTLYMGDAAISYGISNVLGLPNTANTYWVYAYDPTFSGGAVTIYATTNDPNISGNTTYAAANGYVFCGKVTTVVNQTTNNNGSGGGGLPP